MTDTPTLVAVIDKWGKAGKLVLFRIVGETAERYYVERITPIPEKSMRWTWDSLTKKGPKDKRYIHRYQAAFFPNSEQAFEQLHARYMRWDVDQAEESKRYEDATTRLREQFYDDIGSLAIKQNQWPAKP